MVRSHDPRVTATLAELVRRVRLERRMTQRQAAAAAGISLATWQAVERGGDSRFQELTLASVAHALEIPTEDVFDAAGEELPRPAGGEMPPPPPTPGSSGDGERAADVDEVAHRLRELHDLLSQLADASYHDFLLVADHTRELVRRLLPDRTDR